MIHWSWIIVIVAGMYSGYCVHLGNMSKATLEYTSKVRNAYHNMAKREMEQNEKLSLVLKKLSDKFECVK